MTDRELLELAAKAAGMTITGWPQPDYCTVSDGDKSFGWAPLIFDSDALRLAVKLRLDLEFQSDGGVESYRSFIHDQDWKPNEFCASERGDDPYAATRRAIVRAAADMAK